MIDDYTRIAAGLDEARRQITLDQEMRRFDEVQRQIALGDEMRRFDEAHTQIALLDKMRPSIDQISTVERMEHAFDQVSALERTKAAVDQFSTLRPLIDHSFWNNESARHSLEASSILADTSSRLLQEHQSWERISRSLDAHSDIRLPEPIQIPDLAEKFERALEARAKRDSKFQNQQADLLACIVEAGKNQNEITTEITKLQEILVKEALENSGLQRENSSLQRVVLYFAALSAALALVAVLFK